jgi:probable rRNA maturation factor
MIEVLNEKQFPVDEARLIEAAATVLRQHDEDADTGMTIVIEDNEAITELNRQFRQIDAPTDVLSFPVDEIPLDEDEPPYIGDLVIAHPYATAQAEREGHPLGDSFALLVIHGTLHLLGYDHDTPENRAEMWEAQEKALLALGVSPTLVPSLEGALEDDGQDE